MPYLIVREIIPFENKDKEVTFIHQRTHLILSKPGVYTFQQRDDPALGEQRTLENLVNYYGLTSYFVFTKIEWTEKQVLVEYLCYQIEEHSSAPETYYVKPQKHVHNFIFKLSESFGENSGIEMIAIGKKFFEKCEYPNVTREQMPFGMKIKRQRAIIGSTFEFILSRLAPTTF